MDMYPIVTRFIRFFCNTKTSINQIRLVLCVTPVNATGN